MVRRFLFLFMIFCSFALSLHAGVHDISIGGKIGVGLATSGSTRFVGVKPDTPLAAILSNDVAFQGALYNHISCSIALYGDIGLFQWLAITPEFLFFTGNRNRIVDRNNTVISSPADLSGNTVIPEIVLWPLWDQELKFFEFQFDVLAKFRYGWMFIGIGPGLTIATAPRFVHNKDLNNVYQRKAKVDFIGVFDIGINVPVDQEKHHFVTFDVRANFNISGMIGFAQATKRWENGDLKPVDNYIRGVNAVRGTFYVGYMYRF